jgi:hypothetical protein
MEREREYLARLLPALQPREVNSGSHVAQALLAEAKENGLDWKYLLDAALSVMPEEWPRPSGRT